MAGTSLTTVASVTTSAFTATSSQWRTDSVSLGSYAGQSEVMLMFTTISDYGNNLYVYNVNIGSVNVGIEEANASSSFHIFQNPVNDFFNIQLALTINAKMEVTHILGQQIFFEQIPSTQNCVQLNTSGWNNGIYFITI